jgi:5-methylcytosine-specific restriction endonuclease McrA
MKAPKLDLRLAAQRRPNKAWGLGPSGEPACFTSIQPRSGDVMSENNGNVDVVAVLKNCEDYLFPAMKMTVRERSLYYHLFRQTRLIGKENGLFGIAPLASAVASSATSIREDIRSLHERGIIQIDERTRHGHLLRVFLPSEIDGVVPKHSALPTVDIETIDFFADRKYLATLLARENNVCFYCLKGIRPDNCELDHVVARAGGTDNSYRNIVATCHECNTTKQARDAADFMRWLYRRGTLSQAELENRLSALEQLRAGRSIPDLGRNENTDSSPLLCQSPNREEEPVLHSRKELHE